MARPKVNTSDFETATEAFEVLIQGRKANATHPPSRLFRSLRNPDVYREFLKNCADQDNTWDLAKFRKGLLLVVKAIGATKVSEVTGISRVTIYRMLSKDGNPRLTSLITLFNALKIKMFVVEKEFERRK